MKYTSIENEDKDTCNLVEKKSLIINRISSFIIRRINKLPVVLFPLN